MVSQRYCTVLVTTVWLGIGIPCFSVFAGNQDELPSALSGFESSELFDFQDGTFLAPTNEHLIRLLFRAKKTPARYFRRYSRFTNGTDLSEIAATPQPFRAQVFRFAGRIKKLRTYRLPKQYDDTEVSRFNLVRIVSQSGAEIVVAANSIPKAWRVAKSIDEPVEFYGFFQSLVNFNSTEDGHIGSELGVQSDSTPFFVAQRIGWFPVQPSSVLHVGPSQVVLAKSGVDIGQFDFVRETNNTAISNKDAACFFQMLAAVHAMPGRTLDVERLDFQELLRKKDRRYGDAVRLDGHVRRAVKLYIDRRDVRKQLGVDHYYELDMFIPLGATRIAFASRPANDPDADPIETLYEHRFPTTVCVTSLPCSTEEIRGKRIVVDGFFFKFWNYESEYTSRLNPELGQICPLVIGLQPTVDKASRNAIDQLLFIPVGIMAFGIVFMIWIYRRSDQANRNPVIRSKSELPETVDLSGVVER